MSFTKYKKKAKHEIKFNLIKLNRSNDSDCLFLKECGNGDIWFKVAGVLGI